MSAKRTDANQKEIVKAFRELGATVAVISDMGKGIPDLIVGFRGVNWLVEVKDGSKSPSAQALTEPEEIFHREWRGHVCIVRSIRDVLKLMHAH